jgi:orotidine-5'-phosphate decarboxylase
MSFIAKLQARWLSADSLLCVGFDPDPARFPPRLRERPDALFAFCCAIAEATADLVCAFKPQIAYFAAARAEEQLENLIVWLRSRYPDIPVILDAKRGDIGATAQMYAKEAFERYQADAVTLSPYLGFDSIEPYLGWRDRGAIVLCRTSNDGAADLQSLRVSAQDDQAADATMPLYEHIARLTATTWNRNGQMALVVGATAPNELARVRSIVGTLPLLVPGIGAQGGDVAAAVAAGQTRNGTGMIINSSRAILYADSGTGFAQAARQVAQRTRDEINRHRAR